MTQYARQGDNMFYGRIDPIPEGVYQCIDCVYNLEPVYKDSIFSHFKHEANSRKAHMAAHNGELCSQMDANFQKNKQSEQREKKYNKATFERLLSLAERGELDPAQVMGHLRYLQSYIDNFSVQLVEIKRANRGVEEKHKELAQFGELLAQQQRDLYDRETTIEKRLKSEVHEYEKAVRAKLQLEWHKLNETKSALFNLKNTKAGAVKELMNKIDEELYDIPPFGSNHEDYVKRRPLEGFSIDT